MRNDLTDITVIADRSGSMHSCQSDAEGGINTFIEEQKKAEGSATFTLMQFDTACEFVHSGVPIATVSPYRLVPRGSTALLDAVGRAINEAGSRLEGVSEAERPGCVVFVIVTDGHENSSREFTKVQIKDMITKQQEQYNWQFTFLGADVQAFAEAQAMGVPTAGIGTHDPQKSSKAYQAASANVSRMRCALQAGAPIQNAYSDEERRRMN